MSITGLVFTWVKAAAAEKAAEAAKNASNETKKSLRIYDSAGCLARLEMLFRESNTLLQQHLLQLLPDRYVQIRQLLNDLRTLIPGITPPQQRTLQGVIVAIREIEKQVLLTHHLGSQLTPQELVRINGVIDSNGTKLANIRLEITSHI